MKKWIFISFLLIFNSTHADFFQFTDKDESKNTVYVEALGSGGLGYNIIYDRILFTFFDNSITIALGVQYFTSFETMDENEIRFSPQLNYLHGVKHHLEMGTGFTFDYHFKQEKIMFPFRIGYRYQRPTGGFFFRILVSGLYQKDYSCEEECVGGAFPWPGFAVGWSF